MDPTRKALKIPRGNLEPGHIYYLQLDVSKDQEVPIWSEPVRVRIEVPYGPYLYKRITNSANSLKLKNKDTAKDTAGTYNHLDTVLFTWDYSSLSLGTDAEIKLVLFDFTSEKFKIVDVKAKESDGYVEALPLFFGTKIGFAWFLARDPASKMVYYEGIK